MLGVVGATRLGFGSQHRAHDIALVLPHLLQLVRIILQVGLVHILDQLVDVELLSAAHSSAAPLAHGHAQRPEEGEVADGP